MQNLKDERSGTKPDQLKMVKWLQMTFVTVEFLTANSLLLGNDADPKMRHEKVLYYVLYLAQILLPGYLFCCALLK